VPRLMRRVWPASLWHRLSWGLAFTPLVFVVLMSADVTTALAVAMAFAPELFATVAVLVLLFLLGRRMVRAVRRNHAEDR
jgi:NhaP-type Na+/H+ or K+/H+ antiporter